MDFIDENSTLLKNAVCALGEIKSFKKNFHFYFKKKKEVTLLVLFKFLFFIMVFFILLWSSEGIKKIWNMKTKFKQ